MSSNNYFGILLDDIRDQNKAIIEAVGQMQDDVRTLATQAGLQEVADDAAIVKAAVTTTSHDLIALDNKVTSSEQAG
jgi:hypothetical protein